MQLNNYSNNSPQFGVHNTDQLLTSQQIGQHATVEQSYEIVPQAYPLSTGSRSSQRFTEQFLAIKQAIESAVRMLSSKLNGSGGFTPQVRSGFSGYTNTASMSFSDVQHALQALNQNLQATAPVVAQREQAIDRVFRGVNQDQDQGKITNLGLTFDGLTQLADLFGIDKKTATNALGVILNWDRLTSSQKIENAGAVGISLLQDTGVIDQSTAKEYQNFAKQISAISTGRGSSAQKIISALSALSSLTTTSFQGPQSAPTQVEGSAAVMSVPTADGSAGIGLADGRVVAQSEISTGEYNFNALLQAATILASDVESEDKALALGQLGINAAVANELVDSSGAGRLNSVLAIATLANHWSELDAAGRVSGTLSTATNVLDAFGSGLWSEAGEQAAQQIGKQVAEEAVQAGATAATEAGAEAAARAAGENAASQGLNAGQIASYAQYAYQAYQMYEGWANKSEYVSDEQQFLNTSKQIGLMVADYYTFGLASVAYGGLSQMKEFRELEEFMLDISPLTGFGKLNRKTTKMYQLERMQDAFENAATDLDRAEVGYQWERKRQANESGENSNYTLPDYGPLAGRKFDWEEIKHTVIDGSQVLQYQGFRDAFPDLMSGYTSEQRELIAEAAIDLDLLTGDKGNIIFAGSDLEKIQEIAVSVKNGTWTPVKSDEQRYSDVQVFLEGLQASEGYQSQWLGKDIKDASYGIELAKAVAAVDRARAFGEPIPADANVLLTIEHHRRKAAEQAGLPQPTTAPTEEEIATYSPYRN